MGETGSSDQVQDLYTFLKRLLRRRLLCFSLVKGVRALEVRLVWKSRAPELLSRYRSLKAMGIKFVFEPYLFV